MWKLDLNSMNNPGEAMKPLSRNQCCVVTGAGSGIGRATVLHLATHGWQVALVGRRPEALAETAKLASLSRIEPAIFPCDISDSKAVKAMADSVYARFSRVDALVNAAGVNIPNRSLAVLSDADYRSIIETNLNGAYFCVQAFLPAMRRQGEGTIINISSEAGRQASAKSGAAYVISKFGLSGLTQTINAEDRNHGIRACCVFPGDVATPLIDHRPVPPPPEARARMLQPEDVAACVWLALSLPLRAVIEEIVVRPRESRSPQAI
jgi:NAD(P)-dependent dehydrogenase (short-subunit alcohol dehydrogenase family)